MRMAMEFVEEYRAKGYPDERIKIIASMRPEPLRSDVLRVLEESAAGTDAEDSPPALEANAESSAEEMPTQVDVAAPETQLPATAREPAEAQLSEAAPGKSAPQTGKIEEAKRKKVASLRKEQNKLGATLKKKDAQIEKLRGQVAGMRELRKRAEEAASLKKLAERLREERKELVAAKAALESRIADLESGLAQREALVGEKDALLEEKATVASTLEADLSEQRAKTAAAAERNEDLLEKLAQQAEMDKELDAIRDKLDEYASTVEELETEKATLASEEKAKAVRIVDLEASVGRGEEAAVGLQEQLRSNEEAVERLQESLGARESELESLRAHFDVEAGDLRKRAEQEIRMIQRRMRRMRRWAALGIPLAACLLLFFFVGYISNGSRARRLALENITLKDSMAQGGQTEVADNNQTARNRGDEDVYRLDTLNIGGDDLSGDTTGGDAADTPTAGDGTDYFWYMVKDGDSLWDVARDNLGSGTRWPEIARLNGLDDKRPRTIHKGERLKVPGTQPQP